MCVCVCGFVCVCVCLRACVGLCRPPPNTPQQRTTKTKGLSRILRLLQQQQQLLLRKLIHTSVPAELSLNAATLLSYCAVP